MSVKITVGGKEYALYYNVKAQQAISKRCGGDLRKIGEWIKADDTATVLERTMAVITDLINGAVYKHNCEIVLGLAQGDKRDFIPDDLMLCIANPNEIGEYSQKMWEAMGAGMEFEVPDGVQAEERDPDLDFVPSEMEKNS